MKRIGDWNSKTVTITPPARQSIYGEAPLTPTRQIPALVGRLYAIVAELESLFPGRRFTPDGHLVGSIGEVLAAAEYGLTLLPGSAESHDARARAGTLVQIKVTQGNQVALRACCEHLLVLRLHQDGTFDEVYNGPGELAWSAVGPPQKNGQRSIRLSTLKRLMGSVVESTKLPKVNL